MDALRLVESELVENGMVDALLVDRLP